MRRPSALKRTWAARRSRGQPWRSDRMRIWAHRGASARLAENTLAAFAAAVTDGADGVELDVRLDADGHVVVFHDDDLLRLTGVAGAIERLPSAARRQLRVLGEHPVPTLDEALEACGSLSVNVEIKSAWPGAANALAAAVAKVCDRPGVRDRILISSFDPLALIAMRHYGPGLATAYLFHRDQWGPVRRGWPALCIGACVVHPDDELVTSARVSAWHDQGLPVQVWTVDNPLRLSQLAAWGVDGVFANDPAAARKALGR